MPTYMPILWDEKLRASISPSGIRKYLRIPYLFSFPYFSGTTFKLELIINNDTDNSKEIAYTGSLFRLSGITHQTADHIKQTEGKLTVKSKGKIKQTLKLINLPQPGNYSFKLKLQDQSDHPMQMIEGDVVYFDALPKDASAFNFTAALISTIIGLLIGLALRGCS